MGLCFRRLRQGDQGTRVNRSLSSQLPLLTRNIPTFGVFTVSIAQRLPMTLEKGPEPPYYSAERALLRPPDFPRAWCRLAAAHDYIYFFGFDRTPVRLEAAKKALDTATRLRPDAGETHLARADFLYRCYLDYDRARADLAMTERLLPNNSAAFELSGYIDRRQGLWAQSARGLQRAIKLDPRNSFLLQQIAASYQEFRQFGAMAAALDRALAIAPHDLDLRVSRAFVDLEGRADARPLQQTIDALPEPVRTRFRRGDTRARGNSRERYFHGFELSAELLRSAHRARSGR